MINNTYIDTKRFIGNYFFYIEKNEEVVVGS